MKDLKFLLVTNDFNELGISFCKQLDTIGVTKTLNTYENSKIINAIVRFEIDVVFLDVDYLGKNNASRIYHLIANITGKVCIYIEKEELENLDNYKSIMFSEFGLIEYNILKIELISLIIDSLNNFNNNKLIRREKCYNFIYIVWEDLDIKKVEIQSIKEIFKKGNAVYMLCNDSKVTKRIINLSFEKLYKLLNKNFVKSRFKITNQDWIKNNNEREVLFLRKSA